MRIVHLSFSDLNGGAAKAAFRLHRGLVSAGEDSRMLVAYKIGDDPSVDQLETTENRWHRWRRAQRKRLIQNDQNQKASYIPHARDRLHDDRTVWNRLIPPQLPPAEVLQLHWVNGFIDYQSFFPILARTRQPTAWCLHDMAAFTGGCSYSWDCTGYKSKCGDCPLLQNKATNDLSSEIFRRKHQALAKISSGQLTLICLNRWMERQIAESPILSRFQRCSIPNGIDTDTFHPLPIQEARAHLGIDRHKPIVLVVAQDLNDPRKGLSHLIDALRNTQLPRETTLLTVGQGSLAKHSPIPALELGFISSEKDLAVVYAAADVMVNTSLEDNQPTTLLEAMACGTPVISFAVGGIPEMIENARTGLLVSRADSAALGRALQTMLNPSNRQSEEWRGRCREHVLRNFMRQTQIERYRSLYSSRLNAVHF